jgi:hypothetical protein
MKRPWPLFRREDVVGVGIVLTFLSILVLAAAILYLP